MTDKKPEDTAKATSSSDNAKKPVEDMKSEEAKKASANESK